MHRRAGKSVLFSALLMSIGSQGKPGQAFHYVGPSIKQTKAIAWRYVTQISQAIGGCVLNQSDLMCTFPNGATLELLGVENISSLRGRYSNGIVLDEAQLMPQSHWAYVIRPLLADRKGWAVIGGTPAGWHNLLGWAFKNADGMEGWKRFFHPVGTTDALPEDELASMKVEMSPEAWDQEMECSFDAAIQGAFYSTAIRNMSEAQRLGVVPYDARLPVIAALDLGHHDLMPVIWAQELGSELRVIRVEAYRFTSIPDMVHNWRTEVQLPISRLILPHDSKVTDLTSGQTRMEVFEGLGYECVMAPKTSLQEGIEQVRMMLPHTWIDREHANMLYEALGQYKADDNEETGVTKLTPVHNWASHYADAFRYLVQGDRSTYQNWGDRDTSGLGVYA